MGASKGTGRARRVRRGLVVAGGVLALLAPTAAQASKTPAGEHKVTICHATSSATNPYVTITVDVASLLSEKGHDGHERDAIPPFDYGDGFSHPGQSWSDGSTLESCGFVPQ